VGDFLRDLTLKIRFIEFGEQRDPFFFKVGNVESMTIGHGSIVRDYANDIDFPAVRRVGVNLGLDFTGFGLETLVNDLAEPEIFGLRAYFRPFAPGLRAAIGLTGVTDIDPAGDLPETNSEGLTVFEDTRASDPLFLNVGADLDVPIIETDPVSIIAFADVAALFPYLRNGLAEEGLDAGLQSQAVFYETPDGQALRNYGLMGGVLGNIFILDYRLEYRNFQGTFEPGFYGENYDRLRGTKAVQTVEYLKNPDAPEYESSTMGIYGSAGATLFDAVSLSGGYFWPWTQNEAGEVVFADQDRIEFMLGLQEGLLPLGISASFNYTRTNFVPTLIQDEGFENTSLFDANTVFQGQIVYPVAPILDLVGTVTTTVVRDAAGNIVYDENNNPEFSPSVSIETRIGF
jgi:hypothetical protein